MPKSTTTARTAFLTDLEPPIFAALHLPDLSYQRVSVPWLEDYVLVNARAFIEGGVRAVCLQDQTRTRQRAAPETVALMASLGRLLRRELPELELGVIVQAHDPVAPLAIAHAAGARFVRIKTFVGSMLTAEGVHEAVGIEARRYRHQIGADDVVILADVHNRTGVLLADVPTERAALWAEQAGADGVILTGSTFEDSLTSIEDARRAGVGVPLLVGGSVDENNLERALAVSDGVIVSSSLKRNDASEDDLLQWDADRVRVLVRRAASMIKEGSA